MSASLPLAQQDALPAAKRDIAPLLLVPALMLATLPLVGSFPTWVTLTVAGLAMGMMMFIMASGLTLVFGLMSVLNFGHGAFVSVGAFAATLVLVPMRGWLEADSLAANLGVLAMAVIVAMLVTAILGWVFERVIIMPVYGQHWPCRCPPRCAACCCSATSPSKSTACSRSRSASWCSRRCCWC
jgi:branched-chain amino acid transport system permease protein